MKNIFDDEIAYRKQLSDKAYHGIKYEPHEREWLMTHSSFNEELGFPYYNIAVENLGSNQWYTMTIRVESITYDKRIVPILSADGLKGKILANFKLHDFYGKTSLGKPVEMLAFELNEGAESHIDYQSDLGLFKVLYGCDCYNQTLRRTVPESSESGKINFAMTRQRINENTIRYACKSPKDASLDAMIFTIEWHHKKD